MGWFSRGDGKSAAQRAAQKANAITDRAAGEIDRIVPMETAPEGPMPDVHAIPNSHPDAHSQAVDDELARLKEEMDQA